MKHSAACLRYAHDEPEHASFELPCECGGPEPDPMLEMEWLEEEDRFLLATEGRLAGR